MATLAASRGHEVLISDLESIENIHTGILWNNNNNIILKLSNKGTPTFGMVVDSDDRLPLSFVKITLTDSLTNLKNITYTNDQGIFEMSLKKNSTNYIKLERLFNGQSIEGRRECLNM